MPKDAANWTVFSLSDMALPGMVIGAAASAFLAVWLVSAAPLRAEPIAYGPIKTEQARPEPGDGPVATAARIEENGETVRLVFELSAPVAASAFVLADPARIIVDLPQVAFAIDPEVGKPTERARRGNQRGASARLITSFRFGQLEQGKSRIVIDLSAPARILRANCEKSDGDGKQSLVVEVTETDPASFAAAVKSARSVLATQSQTRTEPKLEPPAGKPVVVIDPGHGGVDSGAIVNGLVEKKLVLEFAKALVAKLEVDGRVTTVMTRNDDSFVPLAERVKMARDGDAALFVSIHADTLSDAEDVSGATIYTVSKRASDAEAARVAEKENQSDAAAGLDGKQDAGEVSDILFDLTRRETRAYSHVFARTLANYWKVAARLNKNPQRSAGFRVLKAPDVPSVLLELGYLSNEQDDVSLTSPEWRDKTSSRVAAAIEAFFSARGSVGTMPSDEKESGEKEPAPSETIAPASLKGASDPGDATASIPAPDMAHERR